MKWRSAGRTDIGKVRKRNEDAILDRPDAGLWAVADGLGGHADGDHASGLIVERLAALPRVGSVFDFIESIEDTLAAVNAELQRVALERDVDIIASTVVLLVLGEACMFCGWLGDSRAYSCADGQLVQITRDHVYRAADAIASFGDAGSPAAAGNAPLTRAVGVEPSFFVDWVVAGHRPGARFVLCSDGLNKELSDAEIADACRRHGSPGSLLDELFKMALGRAARDNVSAIVVQRQDRHAAREPAGKAPRMRTQPAVRDTPWREIDRTLHGLNEDYRLGRIDREAYRDRRRKLLGTLHGSDQTWPAHGRWWSRLFG